MWGVFVPPPGYFGDGGHWAFERTAWFCYHGIMAEMEIQCLNDVGGVIFGAWTDQTHVMIFTVTSFAGCISAEYVFWIMPLKNNASLWNEHFVLTVLPDLLSLCPEGDVGLFQVEQSPRFRAEVGPVEAGQGHVIAMEAHRAAQLHSVLRQRHLEEGDVAAGDYLQHPGPVAVMGRIHVCVTETVWETQNEKQGGCRQINQLWLECEACCWD